MNDGLRSVLIGTPLSVAAVIAICLTLTRGRVKASEAQLRAAVRVLVVAIFLQAAHFAEEAATGLHQRLPELLGLNSCRFPSSWGLISSGSGSGA